MSRDTARARKLALHQQVWALRMAGGTYAAIAERTGLSRTGVFDICKRQTLATAAEAAPQPRRPAAPGRSLSAAQELQLCGWLVAHTPEQVLAPPWAPQSPGLWTRAAVAALLGQRLGLSLAARSLDGYLLRWGIVPAKPLGWVDEPPASAGNRWLRADYPAILARARVEGAEIHWAGPGPGVGPGAALTGTGGPWMCSVSNRGLMRWRSLHAQPGAAAWSDFLARLLDGAARKLFLIVEPAPWQRVAAMRQRLAELEDRLELFHRPKAR